MQTDLITKVYFNEHLTHSCVGMPQGLQALLSSYYCYYCIKPSEFQVDLYWNLSGISELQHTRMLA